MCKKTLEDFVQLYDSKYPEEEAVFYHTDQELPWLTDEKQMADNLPMSLRLTKLSVLPKASVKPPVPMITSDKLQDQYFKDGFVTKSEPLLITQPQELQKLEIGGALLMLMMMVMVMMLTVMMMQ